jgi:hypothetical protein
MRRPIDTGLAATAVSTEEAWKLQPHFTEYRRNPVPPPILHVAGSTARPAVWSKQGMVASLRGDYVPLNVREQLLRLSQRQPQVGEITKIIRPADRHPVGASGLTINPGLNQPQHQFHPRFPSR